MDLNQNLGRYKKSNTYGSKCGLGERGPRNLIIGNLCFEDTWKKRDLHSKKLKPYTSSKPGNGRNVHISLWLQDFHNRINRRISRTGTNRFDRWFLEKPIQPPENPTEAPLPFCRDKRKTEKSIYKRIRKVLNMYKKIKAQH